MTLELEAIEEELIAMPPEQRLQLARRLIDSVLNETGKPADPARSLLALAGRFSGGPGDTAERAETILEAEIGRNGFGDHP
jgi:hypothetical protein